MINDYFITLPTYLNDKFSNKGGGPRGSKRGKAKGMSKSNKIEIGGKIINRDREMVYSNQLNNAYQNAEKFN